MKLSMAIDLNRCIGCRTCVVVCKNHNAEPEGIWWNRVFSSGSPEYGTSAEVDGGPRTEFTPVCCQQCEWAPCVSACPTGASYINEDTGVVLVDYESCIGCRYCMIACPYNVRQFNWQKPDGIDGVDYQYSYGYPFEVRDDGKLVYTPHRPEGVVEKCTFCVQYTSKGEKPACCVACPADARIFGDADDPDSDYSKYIEGKETYILGAEYDTHPKCTYIPSQRESTNVSGSDLSTQQAAVEERMKEPADKAAAEYDGAKPESSSASSSAESSSTSSADSSSSASSGSAGSSGSDASSASDSSGADGSPASGSDSYSASSSTGSSSSASSDSSEEGGE